MNYENNEESIHLSNLIQVIENKLSVTSPFQSDLSPIFDSEEEYRSWKKEKDQYKIQYASLRPGFNSSSPTFLAFPSSSVSINTHKSLLKASMLFFPPYSTTIIVSFTPIITTTTETL